MSAAVSIPAAESPAFSLVGVRVDALSLAYRVRFDERFVTALKAAAEVAKRHGESPFQHDSIRGRLKFSRTDRSWFLTSASYRMRFFLSGATGAVEAGEESEPGWTFEIHWNAESLAIRGVRYHRERGRQIARSLGETYESRLRRLDVCVDLAGWQVCAADFAQFVRRPNSRTDGHAFGVKDLERIIEEDGLTGAEAERVTTHFRTALTGFTFCPGGEVLARVYDKRAELAVRPGKRVAEEMRWRARGWDGEAPVTRVEFQIRGQALAELGVRSPDRPVDPETQESFFGLEAVVDRLWRRMLGWIYMVQVEKEYDEKGNELRASRRTMDPRWQMLFEAVFVQPAAGAHGRVRVRTGATTEQTLGCVLSNLGVHDSLGGLPLPDEVIVDEESSIGAGTHDPEIEALALVRACLRLYYARAADLAAEAMVEAWTPGGAIEHLAVRIRAARDRFTDGEAVAHRFALA